MALFITGKSKCKICNKVLEKDDSIIAFPAFVANRKDPLFFFSDEAFHAACLETNQLAKKALELSDQFLFKISPENRFCDIGGNSIVDGDSFMVIPLLTSDETEDLFKYNFLAIDRNNIKNWKDRELFVATLKKFRDDGKWDELPRYNYLDRFLQNFE